MRTEKKDLMWKYESFSLMLWQRYYDCSCMINLKLKEWKRKWRRGKKRHIGKKMRGARWRMYEWDRVRCWGGIQDQSISLWQTYKASQTLARCLYVTNAQVMVEEGFDAEEALWPGFVLISFFKELVFVCLSMNWNHRLETAGRGSNTACDHHVAWTAKSELAAAPMGDAVKRNWLWCQDAHVNPHKSSQIILLL